MTLSSTLQTDQGPQLLTIWFSTETTKHYGTSFIIVGLHSHTCTCAYFMRTYYFLNPTTQQSTLAALVTEIGHGVTVVVDAPELLNVILHRQVLEWWWRDR